jgi:hypothetical protein
MRLLEGAHVRRLVHEVELLANRPVELLGDPHRRVDAGLLHHRLEQLRQRPEDLEVRPDLRLDAGPLDLHHHRVTAERRRPVDLGDARRGQRLRLDAREGLLRGAAQACLDLRPHGLERDGSDRVLKEPQLRHELARKQIRTRGENLAELHERRSEILQHPPEAPRRARRPGVRRLLHRLAASDEPEHTGPVEQVGEAVPRGDGRDLPEPVEVLEIQGVSPGCYHRNPPGVVGKTLAR